jgi:ribosomal protein S18 acetylase RimI-like enzyme
MPSDRTQELTPPISVSLAPAREADTLWPMMEAFNAGEQIEVDAGTLRGPLSRLLAEPELGRVWFIQANGATVGYAVLTFGFDLEFAGRDAFLTEIYLQPSARGHGIGRRALGAIEAVAASDLDVKAIHLMVRPENGPAVALYAAAGYATPPRVLLSKTLTRKMPSSP